jgi:sulfur-oxidizing protein SoxX
MRERIADMRRFNPATVMPPFRSTDGLRQVAPAWAGKPALSEQQLDDIVAYLATLAK